MTEIKGTGTRLASLVEDGRLFAKLAARYCRVMEAARIELHQNGAETAMQWILGASEPPVDEGDELGWDGRESAREWFDRVMAADAATAAAGGPVEHTCGSVIVKKAALQAFIGESRSVRDQRDQEFCAGIAESAASAAEFEALVAALDIEE